MRHRPFQACGGASGQPRALKTRTPTNTWLPRACVFSLLCVSAIAWVCLRAALCVVRCGAVCGAMKRRAVVLFFLAFFSLVCGMDHSGVCSCAARAGGERRGRKFSCLTSRFWPPPAPPLAPSLPSYCLPPACTACLTSTSAGC